MAEKKGGPSSPSGSKQMDSSSPKKSDLRSVPSYPGHRGPAPAADGSSDEADEDDGDAEASYHDDDQRYSDDTGASTLRPRGSAASSDPKRKSLSSKILNKLHLKSNQGEGRRPSSHYDVDHDPQNAASPDYEKFLQDAAMQEAMRDVSGPLKSATVRRKAKSGTTTPHSVPSLAELRTDGLDRRKNPNEPDTATTRHFPGDLFTDDDVRTPLQRNERSGLSRRKGHRSSRDDQDDQRSDGRSECSRDAVYDTDLSEGRRSHELTRDELAERALLTMPFLEGRYSFDSDDSDSMDAVLDDASHYDLIRRAAAEQGHSLNDCTLRELAVNQRDRVSSWLSENDSASGGASHALRKPLIELEEVELKNFLNSFARHTREVRVPDIEARRAKRMPQWSDFRIRPDDGQSLDSSGVRKRTKLLSRVDRGLRNLTHDPEHTDTDGGAGAGPVLSADKLKAPRTSDAKSSPSRERSSITLTSGQDTPSSFCEEEGDSGKGGLRPKSKKRKLSKRDSTSQRRSYGDAGSEDEDWDLIVPSASRDGDGGTRVSTDEVRVDASEEQVDGIAFCIAYILALVERLAPEELDYSVDRGYRESVIRSHVERLYTIAPFWEQLGRKIRRLYRWEEPKTTGVAAMIYFVLWYTDTIPAAFMLSLIYGVLRFKYFPPSESYLHDKVRERMARGQAANKLSEKLRRQSRLDILNIYKRWVQTYGAPSQEALGMLADWHEKVKNLILWRNPTASRRTVILLGVITVFVTFAPAHYVFKALLFFLGITFFCLLPLQSYFPTHRKALSPIWWVLFGAPTDAQFAVQLLRTRHLDLDEAAKSGSAADIRKAAKANKGPMRADKREAGIPLDQVPSTGNGENDFVETTSTMAMKPRKLGSFFCQYKGLPGRLHVNTRFLYFTPLHNGAQKRAHTPLTAVGGLAKTKNIRLWLWSSLGLKVTRSNGKAPLLFANVQNRDEAFNLILAVCSNANAR